MYFETGRGSYDHVCQDDHVFFKTFKAPQPHTVGRHAWGTMLVAAVMLAVQTVPASTKLGTSDLPSRVRSAHTALNEVSWPAP